MENSGYNLLVPRLKSTGAVAQNVVKGSLF